MDRDEQILERAVLRLNAKLLGIVLGLLAGGGLFAATAILVFRGGPNPGEHLGLLAQFFPGYTITYMGSVIGFFYAFGVGYLVGAIIGVVYNKVARV
jgi:hypothetical protein